MVVEFGGGIVSGSLALLADAGHMLSDFGALALAWIGFRMARRPATLQRTFGFRRFPVLAAFVNGIPVYQNGDGESAGGGSLARPPAPNAPAALLA